MILDMVAGAALAKKALCGADPTRQARGSCRSGQDTCDGTIYANRLGDQRTEHRDVLDGELFHHSVGQCRDHGST